MTEKQKAGWDTEGTITVAAAATAMTRWILANMALEGIAIPVALRPYWEVAAMISSGAMALVEVLAVRLVFFAYRKEQSPKRKNFLLGLVITAAVTFALLLTPPLVSEQSRLPVLTVIKPAWIWDNGLQYLWTLAGVLTTIIILAAIGYSEPGVQPKPSQEAPEDKPPKSRPPAPDKKAPAPTSEVTELAKLDYDSFYQLMTSGPEHLRPKNAGALIAAGHTKTKAYEWFKRLNGRQVLSE